MFNMFLHDRRQQVAEDQAFQTKFNQKLLDIKNQHRAHLNRKFEKRLDKFIDYTIANPMEPVNTFVLNESFVKNKTNLGYKTHLGAKDAPSFKTGFYQDKKNLNNSFIDKSDISTIGPVVAKPFIFRKRDTEKEIQPLMRFTNARLQDKQQNKSFLQEIDNKPTSNERAIRYSSDARKVKDVHGGAKFSHSSCSSSVMSSENNHKNEVPKKSEYTCGNWMPLKSVLTRAIDAYGEGKIRGTSRNNRTMNQSLIDDEYSTNNLDDSMLTGIDFLSRSRMAKAHYDPGRAQSVPKARAVLRNANLLKEKDF